MSSRAVLPSSALLAAALLSMSGTGHSQAPRADASPPDTLGALAHAPSRSRWAGAPLRFSTPQFDVVVTTPLSRAWLAAHDDPRAVARACRDLDVVPRDTAAGESFTDWAPAERFTGPEDATAEELAAAVVITIAAIAPTPSPCRGYPARSAGAIADGVAFQRYALHDPGGDVVGARIVGDGVAALPLRVQRASQRVIISKTAPTAESVPSIVRVFLRPEYFDADANGRLKTIQILLARPEDGRPITIVLPVAVARQVHQDLLTHTIAGAALGYHSRLYDPASDDSGRREARVRLALALAALGDSSSARTIAMQVVEYDPCFTLASSAPAGARALFSSRTVPRERCEHDVSGVITRSLLAPGLGHVHADRKVVGIGVAVASAFLFARAATEQADSRSSYDRYVAAGNAIDARNLYARAVQSKQDARRGVILGASLWAASLIEASMREIHHARAMRAVRDYGRIDVSAAPMQGGLAIVIRRP